MSTKKTNVSKFFIIVLISFFLLFGCSNKKKKFIKVDKIDLPENYAVPVGNEIEEVVKSNPDIIPLVPPKRPIIGKTPKTVQYDIPPKVIEKAPIEYPIYFKNRNFKGVVILEVEVFKNGRVGEVNVKKSFSPGPGHLDEAALKSVRQWKYSPALVNGEPIDCWFEIPIELNSEFEK